MMAMLVLCALAGVASGALDDRIIATAKLDPGLDGVTDFDTCTDAVAQLPKLKPQSSLRILEVGKEPAVVTEVKKKYPNTIYTQGGKVNVIAVRRRDLLEEGGPAKKSETKWPNSFFT